MRWLAAVLCLAVVAAEDYASNESVQLFQKYLRINTTSNGDLSAAVTFWQELADQEGLQMQTLEFTSGYPVLVITWPGTNSSLGSIMLNSHMDVVPANEDDGWTYPPFNATLDSDGWIWGRGTQDMKSVSIQYFEALKRLKAKGTLLRDVHMTLMPDEEVGAENGMRKFLASDEFAALNVAVELDEGTSYDLPISPVFYQDKVPWQIQVDCYAATSAHGSTLPATNDTATGKCNNVINKLFEFRDEEYEKYTLATIFNAGTYTSVNLNKINGGTANNVIPNHVSLVFDIRLNITVEEDAFDTQLKEWLAESGDNITLSYILKDAQSPATVISSSNPYWVAINETATQAGKMFLPIVPPGSTDARFVRRAGYPAFGFSPMMNTPLLLHSVNERLSVPTFLEGIDIYEIMIENLANIPAESASSDSSVYVQSTVNKST